MKGWGVLLAVLIVAGCDGSSVTPPQQPMHRAVCGNGSVEPGEQCDDGFTDACGTCNATCSGPGSGAVCGDHVTCPELEICDDGFTDACGTCNPTCTGAGTGAVCGDGVVCPELEACDDGGAPGCGCNDRCTAKTPPRCGDGLVCAVAGEVCDDGFTDACGSCNSDCTGPGTGAVCGDGQVCPELEACDDGYTDACGTCNASCTGAGASAVCGDGVVCPELELCDDGDRDTCGACNDTCSAPGTGACRCGDGIVEAGEACDDGNASDGDFCSSDCQVVDFACTEDHLPAQISGSMLLPGSSGIVPLCDGWIIVADPTADALRVVNAITGAVHHVYPLGREPSELAMDFESQRIFVTHPATGVVSRVDLRTGETKTVALPQHPQHLAIGAHGFFFATLDDRVGLTARVWVVDGANLALLATDPLDGSFRDITFNAPRSELIVNGWGVSPAPLERWAFDASTFGLVLEQKLDDAGIGAGQVSISPDGAHLSYSSGNGTGASQYSLFDFDAADLAQHSGEWAVGPFPRGATFLPDGSRLLVVTDHDFKLYGASSHALLESAPIASSCSIPIWNRALASRGGRLGFASGICDDTTSTNGGVVAWRQLPE